MVQRMMSRDLGELGVFALVARKGGRSLSRSFSPPSSTFLGAGEAGFGMHGGRGVTACHHCVA